MDVKEQAIFLQRRHPWEICRFLFFQRVLADTIPWLKSNGPRSALDVGSGDAWLAGQLAQGSPALRTIICWDTAYAPGQRQAGLPDRLIQTPMRPEGRFDLILLLDVLEHVENDRAFLKSLVADSLAGDGYVLVSVPAWNRLYSEHDRFLGHYRRYSFRATRDVIEASGLRIVQQGGAFHGLLLPRAADVLFERLRKPRQRRMVGVAQWKAGPVLTGAVTLALRVDNGMSRLFSRMGLRVPGLSGWAICQKQP